jgi:hypothetical protein
MHPDHHEYEIDLPNIQLVRILGATECEEILWCKDDIEIMEATLTSTPTSAAGSCPLEGDPGDDDEGRDDNGSKGSPPGMNPPPPRDSPPLGPTNEARDLGSPPGGKTTPTSQPSTSVPPPPPDIEPTGLTGEQGCT